MPRHNYEPARGHVVQLTIDSRVLRDNLIGEPHERTVAVYLPPDYDDGDARYPLMLSLAGFTGSGLKQLAWQGFGESLPQRLDRLRAAGSMGAVVMAFPDCFTRLGGNQYVNSEAMGAWSDFLLEELLPVLESEFRLLPGARHRAVFGKSSGGYGALVQGMLHGDRWGGVACHSGDIGFETAFLSDWPKVLATLGEVDFDVEAFVERFHASPKVRGEQLYALMFLALCASYDPAPDAPLGVRLPVDPRTCKIDVERWSNWMAHDPLVMLEREGCVASLRSLEALYLDCGSRDPYHLHFGARRFVDRLAELEVPHLYDEFDDTHSGIDYRLDVSLPFLYERIRG